jgi:hypothetical protein
VSPDDVKLEPFPHVVVKNAIEDELCAELLREYPQQDAFGGEGSSNKRLGLPANEVVDNETIAAVWREFIDLHASPVFQKQMLDLFADAIRREYPALEQQIGGFESWRSGMRHRESFSQADLLLDAQISINTPVVGAPSSVRRVHLDDPSKLFAGLFYLREEGDDSTGGDLEICRYRSRPRGFRGPEVYDRFVQAVSTVPYARNTLVLFLNTSRSLHGVTVRSRTTHPRRFVNLIAEVERPLFDIDGYQATVVDKALAAPEIVGKRVRQAVPA